MGWRDRAQGRLSVAPDCPHVLDRPICLPCTEGTTRALRLPLTATCKQHGKAWSGMRQGGDPRQRGHKRELPEHSYAQLKA